MSEEAVLEFLDCACQGVHPSRKWKVERAQEMLASDPGLASANVLNAAATANAKALRTLLNQDPTLAVQTGGPRNWSPLLYLCNGRALVPRADAVEAARQLIDHGADPNDYFLAQEQYRYTCITGAIGAGEGDPADTPPHPQARALVEFLLDRGASPNDGQALYNTCFTPENDWLELFLARGLKQGDMPNWKDAYETSNLDFHLCVAAKRGFVERAKLLLKHSANPDALDHYNKRSAYVNALREGHAEIAELLLEAGAKSEPEPEDHLYRAIAEESETRTIELLKAHPELAKLPTTLAGVAKAGLLESVRCVLDRGAEVDPVVDWGVTPLLWAAYFGHREVVELLIARGASTTFRDKGYESSVIGWANEAAAHESVRNHRSPDRTRCGDQCQRFRRTYRARYAGCVPGKVSREPTPSAWSQARFRHEKRAITIK